MGENGKTYFDPVQNGRRRDDKNTIFSKIAAWGMKYNWLFLSGFVLFQLFGFGFKTPRDLFAELKDAITEVKGTVAANKKQVDDDLETVKEKISKADAEQLGLRQLVESSVIAQCKSLSQGATQYLPCKRLYREWGIE